MLIFHFFLYISACFIYQSYALDYMLGMLGRRFYSPEMCLGEGNKDCSFQFPIPYKDNCLIYNTKVCKNYNFSDWNLKALSNPTSEFDSEFTVSIVPYFVYIYDLHAKVPFTAVNISLTSLNKDISGFSLVMTDENNKSKSLCRIFDFRNSLGTFNVPFTLFYDCLHKLSENGWDTVQMTFRAFPLNMEMSYFVYMPPNKKSTSVCAWVPVVMIFHGSLPRNSVQMKFSNAPKELNITFFVLTLWNSYGKEERKTRIPASLKEDMLWKDFISLEGGFYSLSIDIISTRNFCTVFKSQDFLVGNVKKDYTLIIFIILLIIMLISGSGLLYFICRWYLKKTVSATKPVVLFIYHYKPLQHEFLVMYGKYLENKYGVKFNTIYKRSGNPKAWLDTKYKESDVVIFVISEGLFQKFEQNASFKEEHHWVKQLSEAKALINFSKISEAGKKKICKISFPYSGRQHVPKSLEDFGPFFMLPNDEDEFLCFIYNCPKKLYLLNKLCCKNHHKIRNPNLKCKDDEKIKEKLSSLIGYKFDALLTDNFKTIPESNVQNNHIKEPGTLDEKCNSIPISECSNEQKVASVELPKQSDTLQEKCNSVSTSDSLNKHKVENVILPVDESPSKQEPDSNETDSDINDDFFLYCVRKMLNGE